MFGKKLARMWQGQGPGLMGPRAPRRSWVVAAEQFILRLVSFGFSGASAWAIARVFAPPGAEFSRQVVGMVIAAGFAVTGFFLSRNIAYRLMDGEVIWAYLPVCLVVEVVEIFCNYLAGVSDLHLEVLLQGIPASQHGFLTTMAYIVVSSIPAMTLFLSVADADFERRKMAASKGQPKPSPLGPYANGYQGMASRQPQRQVGQPQRVPGQGQPPQGYSGAANPIQGVTVPYSGVHNY